MSTEKENSSLLDLSLAEAQYDNARYFRDAQESEVRGAVSARGNGTDYYEDEDDFLNDVRRREEAWDYWQAKMDRVKVEIFRLSLKTGKRSECLE